jgi:UDP-N-acetylglucosamine 2-epimerase
MELVSVIGTRPQFIKYAVLSRHLRKFCRDIVIHTGQHYDFNMNKVFFDELGIPEVDYHLGVGSGTPASQTAEMLKGIETITTDTRPDAMMVYGDTNSTIAGALVAVKLGLPVAHVEAGLRSFDKSMPEEINRRVTDHCSDRLFCPTTTAVENLKKEGITEGVYLTGDVMVDALELYREAAERMQVPEKLGLAGKRYLVATVHRAGNTDTRHKLESIVFSLIDLGKSGETIVFPVHPRTEKKLKDYGLYELLQGCIMMTEPLGYLEFLNLLKYSAMVVTDSGGIQKEAYILGVPCVTLRENTEWMETVEDGWNVLAGTDTSKISAMVRTFRPEHPRFNLFRQGACERIAGIVRIW